MGSLDGKRREGGKGVKAGRKHGGEASWVLDRIGAVNGAQRKGGGHAGRGGRE
jgi:hypothetical protein